MVLRYSPTSLNILFQKMKSTSSFKIEDNGISLTSSIAVANNNYFNNELTQVVELGQNPHTRILPGELAINDEVELG